MNAPPDDRRHVARRESDQAGAAVGDVLATAEHALDVAERRGRRLAWLAGVAWAVAALLGVRVTVTGSQTQIDELRAAVARSDSARGAELAAMRATLDQMQAAARVERERQDWLVQLRCRELRRTLPDLYVSQCQSPLVQPQAFRPPALRASLLALGARPFLLVTP